MPTQLNRTTSPFGAVLQHPRLDLGGPRLASRPPPRSHLSDDPTIALDLGSLGSIGAALESATIGPTGCVVRAERSDVADAGVESLLVSKQQVQPRLGKRPSSEPRGAAFPECRVANR